MLSLPSPSPAKALLPQKGREVSEESPWLVRSKGSKAAEEPPVPGPEETAEGTTAPGKEAAAAEQEPEPRKTQLPPTISSAAATDSPMGCSGQGQRRAGPAGAEAEAEAKDKDVGTGATAADKSATEDSAEGMQTNTDGGTEAAAEAKTVAEAAEPDTEGTAVRPLPFLLAEGFCDPAILTETTGTEGETDEETGTPKKTLKGDCEKNDGQARRKADDKNSRRPSQ